MRSRLLPISAVICTYNRGKYLESVLKSLAAQTLERREFEIIVIDDGSSDDTRSIAESFCRSLPIKYFYQENSGLAASKNRGIHEARGNIVLFLDDDDIAASNLLEEHLKTHEKYPDSRYAVLNYTTWASNLFITPIMKFITEIGCFLFSYGKIKDGDILDYTYFWGGRSSCKRSFLLEHGVFNSIFRFGCEDIELGYRLSKHGLKVVYNARAISRMIRPVVLQDFFKRLVKQGRSQYCFSMMYDDSEVHEWCETIGFEEAWEKMRPVYEAVMKSARELDKIANMKIARGLELDKETERLLHQAYWWAFRACKVKGMIDAYVQCHDEVRT